jgi:hypothetical protein
MINSHPYFLKTVRRLTCRSSASKQCWMQLRWLTRPSIVEIGGGVRILTIARARRGTQPATSLHLRSVAKIRTIETGVMLSAIETTVTRLKTGVKDEIASSTNNATKWIVITMALTMINPTDNVLRKEDAMRGGGVKAFSCHFKRV